MVSLYVKRRSQRYEWNRLEEVEIEGYFENKLRYIVKVRMVESSWVMDGAIMRWVGGGEGAIGQLGERGAGGEEGERG